MDRIVRPRRFDRDLVILGGGSAGLVAAQTASALKARVTLIEKKRMGGDCLNTGCVPSKALIRVARTFAERFRAKELGIRSIQFDFDFGEIMHQIHEVIGRLEHHDSVERYAALGVECILGDARIQSPFQVAIGGRTISTRNILVATGAAPFVPDIPGLKDVPYLTSDNLWELRTLPKRLAILGGGTIGCELAQCFARFGSQVVQFERNARLVPREEQEVSELLHTVFREEGVELKLNSCVKAVRRNGEGVVVSYEGAGGELKEEFDAILVALGRRANVDGFGLKELGVALTPQGSVPSDRYLRTNYSNVFVAGDVTGPFQFTHTAGHQAWYAAFNALFAPFTKLSVDYKVIPWATFTDPEIAKVGMGEAEAKHAKIAYEVTQYPLAEVDRAVTDRERRGFIKVLTQRGSDRILGVSIVGSHASDTIVEFVTAMKYRIGLRKVLKTIHIYPTFAEANRFIASQWHASHRSPTLLRCLEKFHAWRRRERFLPF